MKSKIVSVIVILSYSFFVSGMTPGTMDDYVQNLSKISDQKKQMDYVIKNINILENCFYTDIEILNGSKYVKDPSQCVTQYEKLLPLLINNPRALNYMFHTLMNLQLRNKQGGQTSQLQKNQQCLLDCNKESLSLFIKKTFQATEKFLSEESYDEEKKIEHLSLLLRPEIYDPMLKIKISKHKDKIFMWLFCSKVLRKSLPKNVKNIVINHSYNKIASEKIENLGKIENLAKIWSEMFDEIDLFMQFDSKTLARIVITELGKKECSKNSLSRGKLSTSGFTDWWCERKEKLFGVACFDKDSLLGSLCLK